MSDVFLKLLNLSITASRLILAVILVRFLLKKAPKRISCVLWALAAVRLVCPFSSESVLSLIPSSETVSTTHFSTRPYIQSGVDVIDNAANGYLGSRYYEGVTVSPWDSLTNPVNVISVIRLLGIAVMLLYIDESGNLFTENDGILRAFIKKWKNRVGSFRLCSL